MSESTRIERTAVELLGEMRDVATEKGIEAAIAHFTVAAMTDPEASLVTHQIALMRALRRFLSEPVEHEIHQYWAEVHFDLPEGGVR